MENQWLAWSATFFSLLIEGEGELNVIWDHDCIDHLLGEVSQFGLDAAVAHAHSGQSRTDVPGST